MRTIFFSLMLCLISLPMAAAEMVHVAAASNFTSAMQQLIEQFEHDTHYRVTTSYASSGKLFAQISNGAPYDVFLSADSARPRRLERLGLIADGEPFTYAKGEIVLWAPQADSSEEALRQLQQGEFSFMAIANPKTAPYGAAAMQALAKLGLDKYYLKRTAKGENIAQTYQFIYSGNAQLGFVARSQIIDAGDALKGAVWQVPLVMYTPIEQQAVLLKRGKDNQAARAFIEYLRSNDAAQTIAASGYGQLPQFASRD